MKTTADAIAGGSFLVNAVGASGVFTREDLTDEQRMFGRTALEVV